MAEYGILHVNYVLLGTRYPPLYGRCGLRFNFWNLCMQSKVTISKPQSCKKPLKQKTVILFYVRRSPSLIKHQTCFPSSPIRKTSIVISKGNFLFLCVALGTLLVSNGIESLHIKVDRKKMLISFTKKKKT